MVMEIRIIGESTGDGVSAKCFGFDEPAMPFLWGEMALTDAHQGI
jgi:hypothetical protein